MQKAPPTPKGFRDILPDAAGVRRQVINQIADVLEKEGFEPIETPTIEFAETLTGKYGEEEKLIYKFTDRGERELALRYDLTVPLARFIASNQQLMRNGPFRRYQIGQVFRGENPQHGRYREFTQFDFDTVGSDSLEEDAKIIATAIKAVRSLGLTSASMAINHRNYFKDVPPAVVRAWDKYHKVGEVGVIEELVSGGMPKEEARKSVDLLNRPGKSDEFEQLRSKLESHELEFGKHFFFDRTLARGLDYYTGNIFELKPTGKPGELSIGAGGRYDNLIGMFAGKQIPAVGFSFGIDRLIESLNAQD
ncbi:histidine--tRNA ligase [Candidatus Curtissbacteria bacterium]|nr:histidine--tRNA ligase [Candidatus Curtissbacteria bacterium]